MIERNITKDELSHLKVIGEGSEGVVYNAHNGLLYKVYKDSCYTTLDPEHTKKMYSPRIIYTAVERQEDIKNSVLPLGPLYINNKFKGCILKKHSGYVDLHNISILPKKLKLNILRQLIINVKELTDHFIYHLDLSNKNTSNGTHSNILISMKGHLQIIDLDGKSTTYTPGYIEEYFQMTLTSLLSLISDLIFDIDFAAIDVTEMDVDYLLHGLIKNGIPTEVARKVIYQPNVTYNDLNEIIDVAEKCKKLTI